MRWIGLCLLAAGAIAAELPPGVDPVKLGQSFARELRSAAPSEKANFTGVLKISKPGFTDSVPISCKIDVRADGWTVTYQTKGSSNQPPQRLVIRHTPDKPTVYLYAEGKGELRELSRQQLTLPLAGSDFWIMDLGLEFLHWPEQRVTKFEMRRGQSCRVLESRDPKPLPGSYIRVVTSVDVDSGGILIAEAYDAAGREMKIFEPGSFARVKGEYQLKDMEIRNPKAKTRTKLEFNLEK
jgi:hypothetical protein